MTNTVEFGNVKCRFVAIPRRPLLLMDELLDRELIVGVSVTFSACSLLTSRSNICLYDLILIFRRLTAMTN